MKGMILAGGSGTRLRPMTNAVPKQLLPVFDKPLIYYPLSLLMEAGIREILVITGSEERGLFERVLGDGRAFGVRLFYEVQEVPRGIADAFLIGASFCGAGPVCLVLGDNIFYGSDMRGRLEKMCSSHREGAVVFACKTHTPERFGIVELDEAGRAISLEEKPTRPKSNWAVTGLYIYDGHAVDLARDLRPSARGELEITDLNARYLERGVLRVECLGEDWVWFDAGTPESLFEAASFVRETQRRTQSRIGDPQDVARRQGFTKSLGG